MHSNDILLYAAAWVISYACLIGSFYMAAHIWAARKIKKYLDETSSIRHDDDQ